MKGVWWLLTVTGAVTYACALIRRLRDALPIPLEPETLLLVSLLCGVLAVAGFLLEGRRGVGFVLAGLVAVAAVATQFGEYLMEVAR